jgi:Fe-S-cluster containining protein
MVENLPITILDELERVNNSGNGVEIISLDLDLFGESTQFRIGVEDKQAKLADIVPMARLLSTRIIQSVQNILAGNGIAVPCGKGCAVCCHYLTLLSVPEAFRMMEEIMLMPQEQINDIKQYCLKIAGQYQKQLSKYGAFNVSLNTNIVNEPQLMEIAEWYFKKKLPCPFLHNNLCTIYGQRPVACREYLVAGSVLRCQANDDETARKVRVPILIANALTFLSSELEHREQERVAVPYIFDWHTQNMERHNRTWPAAIMVKRFVEIVKTMKARNTIQEDG